ncbi:MAG: PIG-L family deacetylase [Flavipsychrobacter sp.]|nr:PIG-L family deacetylase [Flavipsychrobacter sp.]
MNKIICLLLACTFGTTYAQQVRPANSGKIYHKIATLKHLTSVLYVAAHPDDENTRLLGWLVNDRNIRTSYLSLTRGDGGQNILGSEQGPALGLIRTHELMEARKIDGAGQFFTRAVDFGFSKSYQETFKHWDEKTLVSDAVTVIQRFKPDVIICRFPPNTQAGHGHHASSAIIAEEAFKACKQQPWQPKRILFNSFRFGDRNTTSESQFKLSVGEYLPLLGMGSGELAGVSRSVHKSQGAGTPSVPGVQTEYFKLVDGDTLINSLFDGIDITWGRVDRKDIGEEIQTILEDYNYNRPDASIPALLTVRSKIETVADTYWRDEKLKEINDIILDCSGFMAEFYTNKPQATIGAALPFTLHVIARSHTPVSMLSVQWIAGHEGDTTANLNLGNDSLYTMQHTITIPAYLPITQPYWLSEPQGTPAFYNIRNNKLLGLPETPNDLNAIVKLKISNTIFDVPVPLSYKKLDPVKGDVVEQLRIVPDVSIEFVTGLEITHADGSADITVRLRPFKNITGAVLMLRGMAGEISTTEKFTLTAYNDTLLTFHLANAQLLKAEKETFDPNDGIEITASITAGKDFYARTQHVIQYSHLPVLQYFTSPVIKIVRSNWKCTAKRIGVVEGPGDFTVTFLRLAGLQVDVLKESDMANPANLKKYDAIVTGIRAVNVEKRMAAWLPVLLQYARDGGTLVMQYNTLQDLSTTQLGPYPFTISDKRVTEEDATVNFIDPKMRLLNYPNKITQDDFKGWVQERGLYFASKWDDKYQPVFSMNDEGEAPLTGSTLFTKVGKGNYIYTSLSFSRQLPAGNKGAIRLFMNMISVGK